MADDDIKIDWVHSTSSIHQQKGRYAIVKGYKIDRLIFQLAMVCIFAFLLYIAWSHNFNLDYYSCGAEPEFNGGPIGLCHNPFYKASTWKNMEYLPSGEYGTKPDALFNSAWYVTFLVIILAFVANHLIHNRRSECHNKMSINSLKTKGR